MPHHTQTFERTAPTFSQSPCYLLLVSADRAHFFAHLLLNDARCAGDLAVIAKARAAATPRAIPDRASRVGLRGRDAARHVPRAGECFHLTRLLRAHVSAPEHEVPSTSHTWIGGRGRRPSRREAAVAVGPVATATLCRPQGTTVVWAMRNVRVTEHVARCGGGAGLRPGRRAAPAPLFRGAAPRTPGSQHGCCRLSLPPGAVSDRACPHPAAPFSTTQDASKLYRAAGVVRAGGVFKADSAGRGIPGIGPC